MEKQYLQDAEPAGVDVTSSFEGREGTSVDVFHFRHLQLAVEVSTSAMLEAPNTSHIPLKQKRQKKYKHPYGSGDAWR